MNLLNRDFRQMKIAGQHTPFWGGQDGRFLHRGEEMMKMYGAKFKEERYVQDGKYWTSAGVSAGIDMSLAIIDDLLGRKYTQAVMLDLEYDPKPPYDAGTPKKTDPLVALMMKEMYDMMMLPYIKDVRRKK